MIAWGREVRMFVPMCLEAMQQEHEADGSGDKSFPVAIDRTCILTSQIVDALIGIFSGIKMFPNRMRKNLDLSGGLIMSEKVMLTLGNEIGRQKAHDVVYNAAQKSVNTIRPYTISLLHYLGGDTTFSTPRGLHKKV